MVGSKLKDLGFKSSLCWGPAVRMGSSHNSYLLLLQQPTGVGGSLNRMAKCPNRTNSLKTCVYTLTFTFHLVSNADLRIHIIPVYLANAWTTWIKIEIELSFTQYVRAKLACRKTPTVMVVRDDTAVVSYCLPLGYLQEKITMRLWFL